MRHDEITTPGVYVVSLYMPGRRQRQIDVVRVVGIYCARERPGPGSHFARFERIGLAKRTVGSVPVEQVLQRITDPRRIEKLTVALTLAGDCAESRMHTERWGRLQAALDELYEHGGIDKAMEQVYVVTLTPPDVRAASERWRARLAAIESGSAPATGDSARIARRALREAHLRMKRSVTGRHEHACEIAFHLVQQRRSASDDYYANGWDDAAAPVEHLSEDRLRLPLPDGSALAVDVLTAQEIRIAWADLPGAPFVHLAEYVRAWQFMHTPDGRELAAADADVRTASAVEVPPT